MRDERIGTVHRTQVIGLLNQALTEGELTEPSYDSRIAAVSTATYASDLLEQVQDLPPRLQWDPRNAARPTPPSKNAGRVALVCGLLSVPTSVCLIGIVFGIVAVVFSFRTNGAHGVAPALIGRVMGIIGTVLSVGATIALVITLQSPTAP